MVSDPAKKHLIRSLRGAHPPGFRTLTLALCAAFGLALLQPSSAQSVEFEHLTVLDGLSHSSVWDLCQDRDGQIWFATGGLLQRYDGYEFVSFQHDPDDPDSVAAGKILKLFEDRNGQLWMGTRSEGIDRFDPSTGSFTHFRPDPEDPKGLSDGRVREIYQDRSGALWFGSYGGLHRFHTDDSSFTNYRHDPTDPTSIGPGLITAILEDRNGNFWVGSSGGLSVFDRSAETFRHYRQDPEDPRSLSDSTILELYEDPTGELWIGTDTGLDRYDRTHDDFIRYSLISGSGDPLSVVEIIQDPDGELWVGTYGDGVFRTDRAATGGPSTGRSADERFVHLKHDPQNRTSLGSDRVHAFRVDRSGILWIAHRDGLDTYDRRRERFIKYRRENGDLAGSKVWYMLEDGSGVLWISAHNGGLTSFDGDQPKRRVLAHYRHDPKDPTSLLSSRTTALLEDSHGELWVGHLQSGLSRMDQTRQQVTRYSPDPENPTSLAFGSIASLLEDRSGTVWVGLLGSGVQRFDREHDAFISYAPDPKDPMSLSSDDAYALHEDRDGSLWVGTYGGLSRFDPISDGFENHAHDPNDRNSLSGNSVNTIHEDEDGVFWIGTTGSGLNRWDRSRDAFRHYRLKDGLPSDTVVGIVEDGDRRLWLATDMGVASLDPSSGAIRTYDADDGLHGNIFFIGPAYRARSGELFFGGDGGVTSFFPDDLDDDPIPPQVMITDLLIDGEPVPLRRLDPDSPLEKPIAETSELVLNHRAKTFSLQFAGLHFASPRKNRYATRLEGYDDWVETDARHRRARYTNLDPGTYRFEVKAANPDGVWNEVGASIRIRVLPPPWRTPWAYGLYALALGAVVLTYLRIQRNKLERERQIATRERAASERLREADRLKDEFLANTSHELRTPLYGMTGLAESLIDGGAGPLPDGARSQLALLVASGRRLTSLVNDILDFSKLKHRSLDLDRKPVDVRALAEVVLSLSQPLVSSKELSLVNAVPEGLPPADADEDRLQQILHNLVGNALKFTESGLVRVGAELDEARGRLVISVSDTGIGIAEEEQHKIFGAFEQADASIERLHGGTGLGLSITRELVELHGGELWLESAPNQGSTFFFTLAPTGGQPAESPSPAGDRHPALPITGPDLDLPDVGATVGIEAAEANSSDLLIVDDEPIIRQVLTNQLASSGYRLRQAANGAEALALVDERVPDLILLDVMMPRMSGYEVCRTLRERFTLDHLPVIFLTAKTQPSDLVVGLAAGANDYLPKPISKSELLARVKTHLDLLAVHRQLSLLVDERATQLHEREQLLHERERLIEMLENRNAELARFNYTVAHDLKNPLTTIKNFVGLVVRDAEAGDHKRLQEDLQRVDRAADQLERLLEELFELSQIERGAGQKAEISLADIAQEAQAELAESLSARGVEVEVASDLPTVYGDRGQLLQMMSHLLSNAVQYLGDSPSPRISIGVADTASGAAIFVRDNGVGIEPKYHQRVFGLFQRLDPEEASGTGVGLALVKRIVEVHGGKVWVESPGRGQGSTFFVSLPSAP